MKRFPVVGSVKIEMRFEMSSLVTTPDQEMWTSWFCLYHSITTL